jgi:hypothetical protein
VNRLRTSGNQSLGRRGRSCPCGQDIIYQNNLPPPNVGAEFHLQPEGSLDVGLPFSGPQPDLRSPPTPEESLHQGKGAPSGKGLGQDGCLIVPPSPATPLRGWNRDENWIIQLGEGLSGHSLRHDLGQLRPAPVFEGMHHGSGSRAEENRRPDRMENRRPVLAFQAFFMEGVTGSLRGLTSGASRSGGLPKARSAGRTDQAILLFRGDPVPAPQAPLGKKEVR